MTFHQHFQKYIIALSDGSGVEVSAFACAKAVDSAGIDLFGGGFLGGLEQTRCGNVSLVGETYEAPNGVETVREKEAFLEALLCYGEMAT